MLNAVSARNEADAMLNGVVSTVVAVSATRAVSPALTQRRRQMDDMNRASLVNPAAKVAVNAGPIAMRGKVKTCQLVRRQTRQQARSTPRLRCLTRLSLLRVTIRNKTATTTDSLVKGVRVNAADVIVAHVLTVRIVLHGTANNRWKALRRSPQKQPRPRLMSNLQHAPATLLCHLLRQPLRRMSNPCPSCRLRTLQFPYYKLKWPLLCRPNQRQHLFRRRSQPLLPQLQRLLPCPPPVCQRFRLSSCRLNP